jgi:hypothetical protein
MPDIYIHPEDQPKKPHHKKLKTKSAAPVSQPKNIERLKNHTHNPLAAFCMYPEKVDFINKEPNEEVILLVRRHFLTNVGWLLLVVLMLFAPLVLDYFPLLNFLPAKFQTAAILFWYLLTLAIFIQGFLSWFFSVNIITNLRVIDVDFENLIYRKVTDAKIENIEDATVQMGSVIRTIFDFGDVLIQTAAEVPEVEFWAVPHPDKIDKILSDLRLEVKSN